MFETSYDNYFVHEIDNGCTYPVKLIICEMKEL